MSSVDDPEKHFLGNLLEDDPLSAGGPLTTSRANEATSQETSNNIVSSSFGSISSPYWPEPPPPYSPPASVEPWFTATQAAHLNQPSDWFSNTDHKDANLNSNSTSNIPIADPFSFGLRPAVPAQLSNNSVPSLTNNVGSQQAQVHHIFHNLHHHTHTHNVQVQNHYFTTPGMESINLSERVLPSSESVANNLYLDWGLSGTNGQTQSLLFSDWKKDALNTTSSDSVANTTSSGSPSDLNIAETIENAPTGQKSYADASSSSSNSSMKKGGAIGSEKKQKQELAKKMSVQKLSSPTAPARIVVNGTPHSAPVVSKMPFSYRDVAARVETNGNGNPAEKMGHDQISVKNSIAVEPKDSKIEKTKSKAAIAESKEYLGAPRQAGDLNKRLSRERKSRADNEFQKITRKTNKNGKEKDSTMPPTPVVLENIPPVDAPSRYDILNNLENLSSRQRGNKKNGNSRAPMIEQVHSRSSSVAEDEAIETEGDISPQRNRSVSVSNQNNRHERNQNSKKEQKKNRNSMQSSQARRRQRRKTVPHWTDNYLWAFADFLMLIGSYISLMFQWTIQLIVDVCLKIYDVCIFSSEALCHGIVHGIKKIAIFFAWVLVYLAVSVWVFLRSFTLARLFENMIFEEHKEITEWGLKSSVPVPNNPMEYVDRLAREKTQDAYVVLGLRSDCSDDEIKRNFKRLSALISPDRVVMDGADEAYDLLHRAFEAIGGPENRIKYIMETAHKSEEHKSITGAFEDLRERIQENRCTVFCDCGNRHIRLVTPIRPSEARYCRRCDMTHPAKPNDIWVEKRLFGLKSVYFTCADNTVYDITEWATCESQRSMLKNMRAHTHNVQYRLVSPPPTTDIFDYGSNFTNGMTNQSYSAPSSDARIFGEFHDEMTLLRHQRTLAQISFKTCEPREEDRSRRAANRRQKRWR